VLEPAYEEWAATNDWADVEVPEGTVIPSPWRTLDAINTAGSSNFDNSIWLGDVPEGDEEKYEKLLRGPMHIVADASYNATLDPKYLMLGDVEAVHKSEQSILTGQHLIRKDPIGAECILGEVVLTNIGEGNPEDYEALNHASSRSLKVLATLRFGMDEVQVQSAADVEQLSRALGARPTVHGFEREIYNPLYITALEGMMTISQTVNALVQPGIPGAEDMSVLEKSKGILGNHLPSILSRLVVAGDIGAQQMAGYAEAGLIEKTDKGIVFKPGIIELLKLRQRSLRGEMPTLAGEGLGYLQDPAFRSVNRYEGCPASAAVKLMSSMMLDALNAEGR
jgi:hypothetical protein